MATNAVSDLNIVSARLSGVHLLQLAAILFHVALKTRSQLE